MTRTIGKAMCVFVALALLGCAAPAGPRPVAIQSGAAPATKPSETKYLPIPSELAADVRNAEQVGRAIFERDRAAEKTTDALLAVPGFRHASAGGAGWLIKDIGGLTYRVVYLHAHGTEVNAEAEADYSTGSDVASNAHLINPPRDLDSDEYAQFLAIGTAVKAEWLSCAETYNEVAIPSGQDAQRTIHVYLIPARKEISSMPQGGFHDFTVSGDGKTILAHYSQTKACLNGDTHTQGKQLMALMASHITSPTPTAFHVFMNLNYRINIFTVTTQNHMLWDVVGGNISLVSTDVGKKTPAGESQ